MKDRLVNIGVLASGGGSNMQAVMDRIADGAIYGRIILLISDNLRAYALQRASQAGIACEVMLLSDYPSRAVYSQAVAERLQQYAVELVLLSGFMRVMTPELIAPYRGRIMNIHPSLIPSFCGPGYYGHHVHEAVLCYGAKVSGCTVHFVEEEVDGGPIILQRVVPVLEDDTPDCLAARVLLEEHQAFPEAVRLYCDGRLSIEGRLVRVLSDGVG